MKTLLVLAAGLTLAAQAVPASAEPFEGYLKLEGVKGEVTDGAHKIDAVTFRRVIGYDKVKSLGFVLHHKGDQVELSGHGMGHGAGLCQIGAKVLAERGMGYAQILEHYYPGAVLQRMY